MVRGQCLTREPVSEKKTWKLPAWIDTFLGVISEILVFEMTVSTHAHTQVIFRFLGFSTDLSLLVSGTTPFLIL